MMQEIKIKNNRNPEALDSTLKMLIGNHRLKRDEDDQFVEEDSYFFIETTDVGFCEFACFNQGYAEKA